MKVLPDQFVVGAEQAVHIQHCEQEERTRALDTQFKQQYRKVVGTVVKQDERPPDPRWDALGKVKL